MRQEDREPAVDLVARRIAAFTATLRDAGFAVGLRESEDAARIIASEFAHRPATLRPALRALFAGRRSEWQRDARRCVGIRKPKRTRPS